MPIAAGPRPARRDGGHGLGLSIARAIANARGAIIGARALPGGGLAIDVTFLAAVGRQVNWRPARGKLGAAVGVTYMWTERWRGRAGP